MTALHLSGDAPPPPVFVETWRGMAAIAAIVSMAFTVGYNWKEVTSLRTDYQQHLLDEQRARDGFALREVVDRQYLELQREVTYLQTLLEQARDRKR